MTSPLTRRCLTELLIPLTLWTTSSCASKSGEAFWATEEVTPFWLTSLGRALAGETEDKKLYFLIGEGNSGLGTLTSTLKDTFGRFVGNISCESLAYAGRGDQTKLASFYVPIKAPVRIIYYSEVPNDDSVKLDAGKLKKISGGRDDITARQNFKDEHTFRLQGTLFGTSNFPPRFGAPSTTILRTARKWSAHRTLTCPTIRSSCENTRATTFVEPMRP